jgi:hypothetical protein
MKIYKNLDEGRGYWSDVVANWVYEISEATNYEHATYHYLEGLQADGVEG